MAERLFCRNGVLTVCIICISINNTKGRENMIIAIKETSDIPIYLQLRNQIVQGISDGRLLPGEQLPTVRGLAEEIGINSMTVNKAYQLLKQEGYITTDRRNGAKVREEFDLKKELSTESKEALHQIISEARIRGFTADEFEQLCKAMFDKED